jgi:hypothetical protein
MLCANEEFLQSPAQVLECPGAKPGAAQNSGAKSGAAQNPGAKSGAAQNYSLRIKNDVLPPAQAPECPSAPGSSNMRSRQCARAAPAQNYGLHMKNGVLSPAHVPKCPGANTCPIKCAAPLQNYGLRVKNLHKCQVPGTAKHMLQKVCGPRTELWLCPSARQQNTCFRKCAAPAQNYGFCD